MSPTPVASATDAASQGDCGSGAHTRITVRSHPRGRRWMSRHAGWHPAAGSADSRSATGPGECEFEGAGHLEQEVLPPWSGDDLDADGQTGGLVMVDGEGDGRLAGHVEHRREHPHRVAVPQGPQGIVLDARAPGTDERRKAGHRRRHEEVEAREEAFDDAP